MKFPILSKLFSSLGIDTKKLLAKMSGDHGKVMAEKELYDRFMESEIGKKIKNLPGGKKWVFVLFNYFFSGIVDQKFNPGNSFFGMIFKDMLDDAASEISKRTINGAPGKPLIPSENPAVKMAFIEMLMKMNPEKAAILINRLVEMNENERRAFIKELEMIVMPENFAKLSELDEETFANLGKISQSKGLTQKVQETTGEILDDINSFLRSKL
ncbi:MAG: hypothetical protein A3J63_03150 [Candidatus Moranbacteria bacterium RIFCSPHIGHO2_02_FULL_40_12b]|nr:MAG: hypothetical protein A3J63_03150 [Candidatus Moranbacteria bacterium RIFCSPHIGHO2_02_FULL_40_12b]OGI23206.1 MAG: hypothetical protein A3E91_01970 [Candidatus Moranbacteria bacterium RIFCSPHIGHO2_12_FULL_40_10]